MMLAEKTQTSITLPSAQDRSVPAARHFADDQLLGWGIGEDDRDSAALVVGELAANAVQHGHADLTLSLTLDEDDLLIITVTDSGAEVVREAPRSELPDDEHGRGTGICEFIALWIETHDSPDGREVRAALSVTPSCVSLTE